jgi:hypothetical protein
MAEEIEETDNVTLEVRPVWPEYPDVEAITANQFAISAGAEGQVLLYVGQLLPPLLGSLEGMEERLKELQRSDATIRVLACYEVPPQQLVALRDVLVRTVEKLEKAMQQAVEKLGGGGS